MFFLGGLWCRGCWVFCLWLWDSVSDLADFPAIQKEARAFGETFSFFLLSFLSA